MLAMEEEEGTTQSKEEEEEEEEGEGHPFLRNIQYQLVDGTQTLEREVIRFVFLVVGRTRMRIHTVLSVSLCRPRHPPDVYFKSYVPSPLSFVIFAAFHANKFPSHRAKTCSPSFSALCLMTSVVTMPLPLPTAALSNRISKTASGRFLGAMTGPDISLLPPILSRPFDPRRAPGPCTFVALLSNCSRIGSRWRTGTGDNVTSGIGRDNMGDNMTI